MLKKALRITSSFVRRNRDTIMTGMTVAGIGCTAYLSGKAAIKAYQVIEEEEYSRGMPLTKKEKFVRTWKIYIPPFAAAVATASISIGAHALNKRTHAVLLESYLAEAAMRKEFEKKTREIVGDKKADKIQHEVNQDKINANPPNESLIIPTQHGHTLFYDNWTGNYFYSKMEFLQSEAASFKGHIIDEDYKSLNDFYYQIDLPTAKCGEDIGWHSKFDDIKNIGDFLEFDTFITSYGEPCITMSFAENPKPGFDDIYRKH